MKRKKIDKNKIFAAVFFIALAIFLLLALISYHPEDPVGFQNEPRYLEVKNLFGILGATIAAPIFKWTFGYGSLIIPIILFYLVFSSFSKTKWHMILENSTKLLLVGVFAGIFLSLPEGLERNGNYIDYYPGGFFTANIVKVLLYFTGKFGSIFILSVSFILYVLWILRDVSFILKFWEWMHKVTVAIFEKFRTIFQSFKNIFKKKEKDEEYLVEEKNFEEDLVNEEEEIEEWNEVEEKRSEQEKILSTEKEQFPEYQERKDYHIEEKKSNEFSEKKLTENSNVHEYPFLEKKYDDEIEEFPPEDFGESPLEKNTEVKNPEPESEVHLDEPEENLDDILLLKRVKEQMQSESSEKESIEFEFEKQVKDREVDLEDFIQSQLRKYKFPTTDFLEYDQNNEKKVTREELQQNAQLLVETLSHFNVEAKLVKVVEGPVVTQYQLKPAQGVKISKITALQDDLALALRARGIRIIAPIPGKAAIGVEIPNRNRSIVYFKSVIRSERFANFKGALPIALGKNINGEVFCDDLAQMPHLLIAGATGTGKSVGLNVIIASLLYRLPPSDVKFILIDPKRLEFSLYEDLKNHYLAYCPELDEYVITEPDNAVLMLQSLIQEMEKRYNLLKEMGVRSIAEYNNKIKNFTRKDLKEQFKYEHKHLPYLVVIIDELADLMLSSAREVEEPIARLTQKARAAGIHMILATQRPSVNVITGIIKANFPVRIAYQVPQKIDSKVILDMSGAEQLIGKGDMLFKSPAFPKPIRIQTALITTPEVERIVKHIKKQPHFPPYQLELVKRDEAAFSGNGSVGGYRDELFEQAKEIVILHQTASASLLQRKLRIGYARAASIIDQLEEAGIVGPPMGSKPRDVLVDKEAYLRGDVL